MVPARDAGSRDPAYRIVGQAACPDVAPVRVRCLPSCLRCPLTPALSPDGGEGISRSCSPGFIVVSFVLSADAVPARQ